MSAATSGLGPHLWYERFCGRRKNFYGAEDTRRLLWNPGDKEGLIKAFMDERKSDLDPPSTYRSSLLQKFLRDGNVPELRSTSRVEQHSTRVADETSIILLDDRRDPTGDHVSTRIWDSSGEDGYLDNPTEGEPSSIYTRVLLVPGLFERLNGPVSAAFI